MTEERLRKITIGELKNADAAFFCGTAAEVIGWQSLDETVFPKPWKDSISAVIQDAYKHRVIEKQFNQSMELA